MNEQSPNRTEQASKRQYSRRQLERARELVADPADFVRKLTVDFGAFQSLADFTISSVDRPNYLKSNAIKRIGLLNYVLETYMLAVTSAILNNTSEKRALLGLIGEYSKKLDSVVFTIGATVDEIERATAQQAIEEDQQFNDNTSNRSASEKKPGLLQGAYRELKNEIRYRTDQADRLIDRGVEAVVSVPRNLANSAMDLVRSFFPGLRWANPDKSVPKPSPQREPEIKPEKSRKSDSESVHRQEALEFVENLLSNELSRLGMMNKAIVDFIGNVYSNYSDYLMKMARPEDQWPPDVLDTPSGKIQLENAAMIYGQFEDLIDLILLSFNEGAGNSELLKDIAVKFYDLLNIQVVGRFDDNTLEMVKRLLRQKMEAAINHSVLRTDQSDSDIFLSILKYFEMGGIQLDTLSHTSEEAVRREADSSVPLYKRVALQINRLYKDMYFRERAGLIEAGLSVVGDDRETSNSASERFNIKDMLRKRGRDMRKRLGKSYTEIDLVGEKTDQEINLARVQFNELVELLNNPEENSPGYDSKLTKVWSEFMTGSPDSKRFGEQTSVDEEHAIRKIALIQSVVESDQLRRRYDWNNLSENFKLLESLHFNRLAKS